MLRNILNKQSLIKNLPYLFYLLIAVFILYYLSTLDYKTIAESQFNISYFILAVLFGLLSITWGAYMWLFILKGLGAQKLSKRELFYVYGKSWLGRYIPGTAPWILGKIGFASQYGVSKKKLATSSVLEAILQLIATLMVSFILIFTSRKSIDLPPISWAVLVVGVVGCVALAQPKVFNFCVDKVFVLIKKTNLEESDKTSLGLNLKTISLYSIGTLLTGFAMFMIAKSVYSATPTESILYIMGASTLSGAIGMMAIFVPSGLGVREVTQTVLLSVVLPTHIAILVSLFSRVWSIIVDILFFVIASVIRSVSKP